MAKSHHYKITTNWTGNTGTGTSSYTGYDRSFAAEGKVAMTVVSRVIDWIE